MFEFKIEVFTIVNKISFSCYLGSSPCRLRPNNFIVKWTIKHDFYFLHNKILSSNIWPTYIWREMEWIWEAENIQHSTNQFILIFVISLQVRNATAVFIINLSLSDLLFCCFNLPLAASTFWYRAWTHGS